MIDVNGRLEVFTFDKWWEAEKVFATELDGVPIVVVDVPTYHKNLFFYVGDGSFAGSFLGSRTSITFCYPDDQCNLKIRNAELKYSYTTRVEFNDFKKSVHAINIKEARAKILEKLEDEEWWKIELIGEE